MELINHNNIINNINNALKQQRLPQSIMITSYENGDHFRVAMEIALKLNCKNIGEDLKPCYNCNSCKSILSLNSPDLFILFPATTNRKEEETFGKFRSLFKSFPYFALQDWTKIASSGSKQLIISVDDVRKLKQSIVYKNFVLKNRIIIIWYAEKMNTQAANALLKSLEEPAPNTYFILTTESYSSLLPTITSRCQKFTLDKIPYEMLKNHLITIQQLSPQQAEIIAKLSEGSISNAYQLMRNLQDNSMLDDLKELLRHIFRGELNKLNDFAYNFAHSDKEYQKHFLNYMLQKLRAALLEKIGASELAVVLEKERKIVSYLAENIEEELLIELIEDLDKGIQYISRNVNVQFWLFQFGTKMYKKRIKN